MRTGAQGKKSEDRGVENITEKSEFRNCCGIWNKWTKNKRRRGQRVPDSRRLFNRPLYQVHTIRRGCMTLQLVWEYTAPALFALMRQGVASGKKPFFISEVIQRRTWRNERCFRFSMNEPRKCRCSATKATNRCTTETRKFSFKYLKCLALGREMSGCISICFAH